MSSIIDDEWDTSDEAPMSLQPGELESARGGPPPVPPPPKRPATGPTPVVPATPPGQTDRKS